MKISIVAVGRVERGIINRLKEGLGISFGRDVSVARDLSHPDYAYDSGRKQYLASAILHDLLQQYEPVGEDRLLGIIDEDLYVPELNFVFGLATGKGAVISITRLRQEFYGMPSDKELFRRRVLTEAIHELGHTFEMDHCHDPHCVMYFSNRLSDTDVKGTEFCQRCRKWVK